MSAYDLSREQQAHAPRAARVAWKQDLCADSDGGPHVCEMYRAHESGLAYRHQHHCECGHDWPPAVGQVLTEPQEGASELPAPLSDGHTVHAEGSCDVDLGGPGSEGI